MVENEEKIFLDKESYQKLIEKIEELKQKLSQNNKEKGEAYSGAVGDGWHDNFAFDEANMQERMILGQIREYYEKLQRVVIVENQQDTTLIDINDVVTIKIIFGPDDSDELQFKLVGSVGTYIDESNSLQEVSINSPLGKSIYHHQVGEKINYKVENRIFYAEILSKYSEKEYLEENKKKKIR